MGSLNIGSFNVKDNLINSKGGKRHDGICNADIVKDIISDYQLDLIGSQELTIKYVNELSLRLLNYKFYGNYRFGNILKNFPCNESNHIITNQKVLYEKTVWLPWIADNFKDLSTSIVKFSIMPRVATIIIAENDDFKQYCMINTHLDYKIPSIQKKQLEKLKQIIYKCSEYFPIILTGDFNMELGNQNFDNFIDGISDISKHVDIKENTWHNKQEAKTLDHIFIPKTWKVEDCGIIDSMGTSDHNIVYAKVYK